jgi:hypothetical protein
MISPLIKFQGDPPVTITTFMLIADAPNLKSFIKMFFRVRSAFLVIVIGASGESRNDQKHCQGVH